MGYGIKDRIADLFRNAAERLSLNKESATHVGLAVVLAVGIGAGISVGVSPNTDAINQDINRLDDSDQIILDAIDELEDSDAARALFLVALNSSVTGQTASINDFTALIDALQMNPANLTCSPPEARLAGAFGNYTLYVKSSTAGNFTANVHLLYSPPLLSGNASNYTAAVDCFYTGINWTQANQLYIPRVAFNGTAWIVAEVIFSIGTFTLEADTEAVLGISFSGLACEPFYAYTQVYKVY